MSHFEVDAQNARSRRYSLAFRDIAEGARLWRLGFTLGWLDIKLKYRGSMLGPFWLTLSTAIMIGAMGTLYSVLFHMDVHAYLPFLATSLVMWNAIGGLVGEACTTFTMSEGTIRAMRMPFFVHVVRVVVRTVIQLAHNLPVIIGVFWFFHSWPGLVAWRAIPGLGLWTLDAVAACFFLGALCARFRDVPPIVGSIMQIAFYITPVIWRPEQLGRKGRFLPLNPFDSLLEIVRAPLLGHHAGWQCYAFAIGYSLLFMLITTALFARVRSRLAFWL